MADASNASEPRSSDPGNVPGGDLIQRMAEYREEHPNAAEYTLTTEAQACELLMMLSEQIRANIPLQPAKRARKDMARIEGAMRRAVLEGRSLHYLARELDEPLEVFGMTIKVPAIAVCQ